MTAEIAQLIVTLKRQLKAQGLTYRDVARCLDLSEGSVKRLFARGRFTLAKLAQIANLLGFTVAELWQAAASTAPMISTLTVEQEARLVSDERLLLVAVCALNHWSFAEIVEAYQLTNSETLKRLIILDRMGLLELLPGDRIRRRVSRDFEWLPDGPIRGYFAAQGLGNFVAGPFDRPPDLLQFSHAMLTDAARKELDGELHRLRGKLASLHEESVSAPLVEKHGMGLLLASREWEPPAFKCLRRQ
jgi:transcriptional regulator with XRE-family HTH domain